MDNLTSKFTLIHTESLDNLNLQNSWLTIGIFDGVHRGHQELLRALISGAHAVGKPAIVLTFTPHPAVILGGKTDFKFLSTPTERFSLLENMGVDVVINQTFNHELASRSAAEFMGTISRNLGLRHLLIGYDTALGHGREGDSKRLIEIGKELGYTVSIIPPLKDDQGVISSTRIRQEITTGDVGAAARDLGRYYDISGMVIHGEGRGHKINIPTANIQAAAGKVIPANGIYACWAFLKNSVRGINSNSADEMKLMAATNVGIRPTFTPELSSPAIEAHLLDFSGNLYNQPVKLEFVEYLRQEEKYSSVERLVDQIGLDILRTREVLG